MNNYDIDFNWEEKMELYEKIKEIRQEKRLSREDLYKKLNGIFGERTIKPNTIWRIESGLTSARASSLHQICIGLGVSLRDILANISPTTTLADFIKKGKRLDQFVYNDRALAENLSPAHLPFLTQELTLSPGGTTDTEEDPIEVAKFEKWIYCLSGKITCVVGTEKHLLDKGDSLSFESTILHHFENNSAKKSRCIIVQNPRHI
jgi:transcriptional regulator with XRE-family HTH domain